MTDGELVRRARAGDRAALADLAHRWAGRVVARCHAVVRHADVADDLGQEALLRALRALPSLADPAKFGPWLCGIALRVCQDWLRARRRAAVPFSVLSDGQADGVLGRPEGPPPIEVAEEQDRLWAAINDLPAELREALLLYYYQDVTYQDVAAQLDVSAATVNARLTKARAMLRSKLAGVPG
jgi:RNA polymerase sigma factor (sigma-70 family)